MEPGELGASLGSLWCSSCGAEMASSGAPSPGSSPVELRHCIAELLRFTLQSRVDGTLNLASDLGLSVEFCSALLRDDPPHDRHPSSSPSPSSGARSRYRFGFGRARFYSMAFVVAGVAEIDEEKVKVSIFMCLAVQDSINLTL